MTAPKAFKAFTLTELLMVLVIMGILLTLGGGFTSNVRNTFVAQTALKQYVQQARILRRKSMLITRNSNETEWVHGIGMQFRYDEANDQWQMFQVKLLDKDSSTFYKKFPIKVNSSEVQNIGENNKEVSDIDSVQRFILPEEFLIKITDLDEDEEIVGCFDITILYESINGKMHAYCRKRYGTFFTQNVIGNDLGIPINSQDDNPNIKIEIGYPGNSGFYNTKIILSSNGEIKTLQEE